MATKYKVEIWVAFDGWRYAFDKRGMDAEFSTEAEAKAFASGLSADSRVVTVEPLRPATPGERFCGAPPMVPDDAPRCVLCGRPSRDLEDGRCRDGCNATAEEARALRDLDARDAGRDAGAERWALETRNQGSY